MPLMKLPTWALTAFGTKGKKKQSQLSEENPSMFDFSHLSGKTKTKGESDNGNEPLKLDSDDTQITRPKQHSRGTMSRYRLKLKITRFWRFVC